MKVIFFHVFMKVLCKWSLWQNAGRILKGQSWKNWICQNSEGTSWQEEQWGVQVDRMGMLTPFWMGQPSWQDGPCELVRWKMCSLAVCWWLANFLMKHLLLAWPSHCHCLESCHLTHQTLSGSTTTEARKRSFWNRPWSLQKNGHDASTVESRYEVDGGSATVTLTWDLQRNTKLRCRHHSLWRSTGLIQLPPLKVSFRYIVNYWKAGTNQGQLCW